MAEATLDMLQKMVQKVLDGQRHHDQEFHDVKARLTTIEQTIAGLKRDDADAVETSANLQSQIDKMGDRLSRIEHRLDLNDA